MRCLGWWHFRCSSGNLLRFCLRGGSRLGRRCSCTGRILPARSGMCLKECPEPLCLRTSCHLVLRSCPECRGTRLLSAILPFLPVPTPSFGASCVRSEE